MLGMSVWESTLERNIPDESLSRVSAYDWFGSYAFYPLGLALWAGAAGAVGVHSALWVAFGVLTAAAAAVIAVPDIRHFRSSRTGAPVA